MRSAVLLGALSLAACSSAVVVSYDAGLSVTKPLSGTSFLVVTGTVLYGGPPPKPVSLLTVGALSATGPGPKFVTADATALEDIVGNFATGSFTGKLFTIAIGPTTVAGTYSGTATIRLKYTGQSATQSTTASISFDVLEAPAAVPEPGALSAIGFGALAVVRRRRR